MRPLPDPLAGQRAALDAAAAAPLPEDWPAHASLVLSRSLLAESISSALDRPLAGGPPMEMNILNTRVRAQPEVSSREITLTASTTCLSCLELRADLRGAHQVRIENNTGSRELELPWSAGFTALFEIGAEDGPTGGRQIVARVAAPAEWEAALEIDRLPALLGDMLGAGLERALKQQLAARELPAIPLVRLRASDPVPLRQARVRPAEDGAIAVDLGFGLPTTSAVTALPDPGDGWAAVLPTGTLQGVLSALVLRHPPQGEPVAPEITGLSTEGGQMTIDLRAWPLEGRPWWTPPPRDLRVSLRPELTEGEIRVTAVDAEVAGFGGRWLEDRILEEFTSTLAAPVPAATDVGEARVVVETLTLSGDGLQMWGALEREATARESAP